ncbi:hypothetical protein CSKR_104862 [Clonorchis sinensis]|uniref:Uncharacterized protein n=2 Tax=Clonorchis sinensis TaxID=79923 RepID=G7YGH4_CLOSI|nr:hypothetical protein CSKR_104862 [Clonorchis sinensis]GAA52057.1 hypothetical protein CLF_107275 [Clonorchis sinensis]
MARIGHGVQIGLSWVQDRDGRVPSNAIDAGCGVYIGRMHQNGDLLPGKVVPRHNQAYCAFGGREHSHHTYEVLCDTAAHRTNKCYGWENSSNGHVPKNAIVAGLASDGSPLYVARAHINGERVVGKVHGGHHCGYFPYGGEEHSLHSYEVLIWQEF